MNAYATEAALQVPSILVMSGEKLHNTGSFTRTSWDGQVDSSGFSWTMGGTYLNDSFTASSIGTYRPVGFFVTEPTKDGITWETKISWRGYELSDEGENIIEEEPAERGLFKRLKSAWKSVQKYVDTAVKIVKTAATVATQAATILAVPTPVTGVVAFVSSAATIYDTWKGNVALSELTTLTDANLTEFPILGVGNFGSEVFGDELAVIIGMDGGLRVNFTTLTDPIASLKASYQSPVTLQAGPSFDGGGDFGHEAPEPGSLALLTFGLAGLGFLARRRRKAA